MPPTVDDLPVLSAEECSAVRTTIMQLRPSWIQRNAAAPFYTLGAATYIDAARDGNWYRSLAMQCNPVLRENFNPLYERVAKVLADRLGTPVGYSDRLALPGFHIYLSSKLFEKPIASIHCDSQYKFHDWSGMDSDLNNPLSFTLTIALPNNGGGLNVWDITLDQLAGKSNVEIGALVRSQAHTFHPYTLGHLAMHSGHIMHQAAPGVDVQPEDERITLQGHGIRVNGSWQLYW